MSHSGRYNDHTALLMVTENPVTTTRFVAGAHLVI